MKHGCALWKMHKDCHQKHTLQCLCVKVTFLVGWVKWFKILLFQMDPTLQNGRLKHFFSYNCVLCFPESVFPYSSNAVKLRLNIYQLEENRQIKPHSFMSMVSNLLYSRRWVLKESQFLNYHDEEDSLKSV